MGQWNSKNRNYLIDRNKIYIMKVFIKNIGENIYPDLNENSEKALKKLKEEYDLDIHFLFSDGLGITFDDKKYEIGSDTSYDLLFLDPKTKKGVLSYTEFPYSLVFKDQHGKIVAEIDRYNTILEEIDDDTYGDN